VEGIYQNQAILAPSHIDLGYLRNVKGWLDSHPNEVLTFVFTNPEGVSLKDVWNPAFVSSGIAPLAYVPSTKPLRQPDWPTLGRMIDGGKRVVVFMDSGADSGGVDYILPEFPMVSSVPQQMIFKINSSRAGLGDTIQRYGSILSLQCRPNKRTSFQRGPHVYDQPLIEHQVIRKQRCHHPRLL